MGEEENKGMKLKLKKLGKLIYKKLNVGDVVQSVGVVMMLVGIGAEIVYVADVYLVVITIGSLVFSVGTKIKGN